MAWRFDYPTCELKSNLNSDFEKRKLVSREVFTEKSSWLPWLSARWVSRFFTWLTKSRVLKVFFRQWITKSLFGQRKLRYVTFQVETRSEILPSQSSSCIGRAVNGSCFPNRSASYLGMLTNHLECSHKWISGWFQSQFERSWPDFTSNSSVVSENERNR